jgi:predicted signal transduction protein with EAL and GGDEF domain
VDAAGTAIAATVSIGVATGHHAGFDLEILLAAADAALYEAKSRGRNRIIVADPQLLRDRADDRAAAADARPAGVLQA